MKFQSLSFKLLIIFIVIILFASFTNHFIANYLLNLYDDAIEERNDSSLNSILSEFEGEKILVEVTVNNLSMYISNQFDDNAQLKVGDLNLLESQLEEILEDYLSYEYGMTDSLYVFFNPELDDAVHDVWLREVNGELIIEQDIPIENYESVDMEWFFTAKDVNKSHWVESYTNQFGEHVVSYVSPMYVGDVFIGVVGMYLDPYRIEMLLSSTSYFEGDFFWIYDSSDLVVYHPFYKEGTHVGVIYDIENSYEMDFYGQKYINYHKETRGGWTFVHSIPKSILLSARKDVKRLVVGGFIIALVILLSLFYGLYRRYYKVFSTVIDGLKRIEAGELQFQIQHNEKNELGMMIDAINSSNEKQMRTQTRLHQLAHFHPVTNLRNRNSFSIEIAEKFENSQHLSMCYINIDQFRVINDLIGYSQGDQFISLIAARLFEQSRGLDLYHISIDEFMIVNEQKDGVSDLVKIAHEVLSDFGKSVEFLGHNFFVTVSIGIVSRNVEFGRLEDFLRASDLAMIQAREDGRNNFRVYDREMYDHLLGLTALEHDFSLGLENDCFEVYYQPKVTLWNNKIDSAEALTRWKHPTRGIVKPEGFIEFAETSGMIIELGYIVIRKVCQQIVKWKEEGNFISIAVNLSIRQIMDDKFIDNLLDILSENGVDPSELEFEITESMFIQDEEVIKERMNKMNTYGIRFSLDDFGSGYSSLHVLNELNVDTLKIDKGLTQKCVNSDNAHLMVETVTHMAHKLGLEVVAEGVESKYELDIIEEIGIDVVQGFYFSRPVPGDELFECISKITKENEGS